MVKLRLKRMGSKYNAFYRIVAADSRAPRDGKYIEELGFYNPHTKEIRVNLELRDKWVSQGAVLSDTVKQLISKYEKTGAKGEVSKLPIKLKKVKVAPAVEVAEEAAPAEENTVEEKVVSAEEAETSETETPSEETTEESKEA